MSGRKSFSANAQEHPWVTCHRHAENGRCARICRRIAFSWGPCNAMPLPGLRWARQGSVPMEKLNELGLEDRIDGLKASRDQVQLDEERVRSQDHGVEVPTVPDVGRWKWRKLSAHSRTKLAVREGFEPSIRCRIHTFQACSFSHSDTSPKLICGRAQALRVALRASLRKGAHFKGNGLQTQPVMA